MADHSLGKGLSICGMIAVVGWVALGQVTTDPPLVQKQNTPPPQGVIGVEDRVPLPDFEPEEAARFPGWEDAVAAVMRISCNGGATGGGVLIGDGDRMLSAAHVFLDESGRLRDSRTSCIAIHTGGDVVLMDIAGMKAGPFQVPDALGSHFSVGITRNDWAVLQLSRVPQGGRALPLAELDELVLEEPFPVLNITGATDNFETPGFLAQVCAYRGVPPSASALNEDGEVYGRPSSDEDRLRVARYDCDIGAGGSRAHL